MPSPSPIAGANLTRPMLSMLNADIANSCNCTMCEQKQNTHMFNDCVGSSQKMFSPSLKNLKLQASCNYGKCQNNLGCASGCTCKMCNKNANSSYGCVMHSQPKNNGLPYSSSKNSCNCEKNFDSSFVNQTNLSNKVASMPNALRYKFNKLRR